MVPADDGEVRMDQLLYTIDQCCRLTATGRTKIYELIAAGEIPARKVGKKTVVAATDLRRWAEQLPTVEVNSAGNERARR